MLSVILKELKDMKYDASKDNSVEIIKEYEKKYDFIKGIDNRTNKGVSLNRHKAILKAKGDYITTLDSDDFFYNNKKLENEMKLIEYYKGKYSKEVIAYSNVKLVNYFGQAYTVGSSALIILALGQMTNVLVGANGSILRMCGHKKLVLVDNILMAMINVIFNAVLIPKIGILGAVLATGISIAIINIIKVLQVKFLFNIIPYNKEYLFLLFNLSVILLSSFLIKFYWDNILSVFIITAVNIGVSISISYKFKSKLDEIMFEKFKRKIKTMSTK